MSPGERYGMLTVVRVVESTGHGRKWLFRCDCGKETVGWSSQVTGGRKRSCGCLVFSRRHVAGSPCAKVPEYQSWRAMRSRCYVESDPGYPGYGARGITVCERWRDNFPAFLADMGPRPPGYTLDRIDSNGNYEPGNCRWATPAAQMRNTRRNVNVILNGKRMCIHDALRTLGRSYWMFRRRVGLGLTPQQALDEMAAMAAAGRFR